MNPVIEKIITMFKEMSMVRKLLLGGLVLVVVAGFITMFVWANKMPYKVAYSGLSQEDAAAVVLGVVEVIRVDVPNPAQHEGIEFAAAFEVDVSELVDGIA